MIYEENLFPVFTSQDEDADEEKTDGDSEDETKDSGDSEDSSNSDSDEVM